MRESVYIGKRNLKKVGKVITYLFLAAFLTVNHPGFSNNTNNSQRFVIVWNKPSSVVISGGGIKQVLCFEKSLHVADYSYLPVYPVEIFDREIYDIQIGVIQSADLSQAEIDLIEYKEFSNAPLFRSLAEKPTY